MGELDYFVSLSYCWSLHSHCFCMDCIKSVWNICASSVPSFSFWIITPFPPFSLHTHTHTHRVLPIAVCEDRRSLHNEVTLTSLPGREARKVFFFNYAPAALSPLQSVDSEGRLLFLFFLSVGKKKTCDTAPKHSLKAVSTFSKNKNLTCCCVCVWTSICVCVSNALLSQEKLESLNMNAI